jgi:hypothetical protein
MEYERNQIELSTCRRPDAADDMIAPPSGHGFVLKRGNSQSVDWTVRKGNSDGS